MKTIFLASVILLSGLVQAQTQLWQTLIDTSVTFSSPRAVKLNGDSILDIVIGGGIDGSPDARGVVALDGANGNVLWEFSTDDEMFASAAFGDANGDGEKDVYMGGRNGEFYAIDGQTGNMIWEFFSLPIHPSC
jgi:outer membrane protein assembly factor BamB